ncbi:hypothetical protein HRbin24_01373 [bacterium HR24]|nr:hypothetical protein HRbin24_01373 [bacterium HR24]
MDAAAGDAGLVSGDGDEGEVESVAGADIYASAAARGDVSGDGHVDQRQDAAVAHLTDCAQVEAASSARAGGVADDSAAADGHRGWLRLSYRQPGPDPAPLAPLGSRVAVEGAVLDDGLPNVGHMEGAALARFTRCHVVAEGAVENGERLAIYGRDGAAAAWPDAASGVSLGDVVLECAILDEDRAEPVGMDAAALAVIGVVADGDPAQGEVPPTGQLDGAAAGLGQGQVLDSEGRAPIYDEQWGSCPMVRTLGGGAGAAAGHGRLVALDGHSHCAAQAEIAAEVVRLALLQDDDEALAWPCVGLFERCPQGALLGIGLLVGVAQAVAGEGVASVLGRVHPENGNGLGQHQQVQRLVGPFDADSHRRRLRPGTGGHHHQGEGTGVAEAAGLAGSLGLDQVRLEAQVEQRGCLYSGSAGAIVGDGEHDGPVLAEVERAEVHDPAGADGEGARCIAALFVCPGIAAAVRWLWPRRPDLVGGDCIAVQVGAVHCRPEGRTGSD